MFVFGCCAGPSGRFERLAGPALDAVMETDSVLLVRRGQRSIHEGYNSIVDEVMTMSGVEGLVLLHDDLRIEDRGTCEKLRALFSDDDIAIVGLVGGVAPVDMDWTSGLWRGYAVDYYNADTQRRVLDFGAGVHDVDTVDGLFLALSPWAIRNLRFDPKYPAWHGYDSEICAQARHAGKRVVTEYIEHEHDTRDARVIGGGSPYQQAVYRWRSKWLTDRSVARRIYWRLRGRALPLEHRLRRRPWVA